MISTGKKSRAVLVRGGEYVVISPNSRLRIAKPKTRNGVVQFFEEVGSVLFRIDKKSTPHFGVDTPYLVAVVKGTTFSVTVSESGTAVQVATRDGGATQLLSPGMIGMVEASQQFRLNIAGPENRVIDSPNAPAGSKATPKPMSEAKLVSIASKSFDGTIEKSASSRPVSLSKATGRMISGTVSAIKPSEAKANSGVAIAGAKSAQPAVLVQSDLAANGNSAANNAGGNGQGNSGSDISGSKGNSSSALGAALIASSQAVANPRQNAIANAAVNAAVNSAAVNGGSNGNGNATANANSNAGGNGMGNVLDDIVTSGDLEVSGGSAANGNGNGNGNGNANSNAGGNGSGGNSGNGNSGGGEMAPDAPDGLDPLGGSVVGNDSGFEEWRNNRGNNANGRGGQGQGRGNGNQGGNDDDDDDDDDDDNNGRGNGRGNNGNGNGGSNNGDDD